MKFLRSLLWWVALIAVSLSTMLWLDKVARSSGGSHDAEGNRSELRKVL